MRAIGFILDVLLDIADLIARWVHDHEGDEPQDPFFPTQTSPKDSLSVWD
jgi:hypothetical protein